MEWAISCYCDRTCDMELHKLNYPAHNLLWHRSLNFKFTLFPGTYYLLVTGACSSSKLAFVSITLLVFSHIFNHSLVWFLAHFPKASLCHLNAVLCICEPPPPLTFDSLIQVLWNLVYTYITTPEPISTAYFLNPSHHSVCLYVYPLIKGK
jgi:hypothetical protein